MNFLLFYLSTIIISFCMDIANSSRLLKDVADIGYKVDIKKVVQIGNQLNPNAKKITTLSLLIPIFNILQVLQKTLKYNNSKHQILNELNIIDALEEMSEKEKQEYAKKPTALNALVIQFKSLTSIPSQITLKFIDNGEENKIIFTFDESLEEINILKVTGPISKLSLEEQKKKTLNIIRETGKSIINEYQNKNNFTNEFNINKEIIIKNNSNNNAQTNNSSQLSTSNQKQKLEELKEEIVSKQQLSEKTYSETQKTFTKKK